ncbi:hypothetical protein BKH42_06890 [Helicobacter sp. 13S00482-2]|uniref:hypothetical protein n=1 Tax=Helicobacter sp. 13S00482-2 TaxID=1476200 RepID=UPI000BA52066|nr:hypothetical protein [Helicobacter sp. 13S00482-2]PAF53248.1 hypothetical protein BKH42_06890 [Helicobacter sp. 13S00482-2]
MKKELLNTLKNALSALGVFNNVDLYEKVAYNSSDYPVCIIKDSEDAIFEISSDCWKIESSIEIGILNDDAMEYVDCVNHILGAIKALPNDVYIYQVESISKQSEYLESLFLQTTISLKVSYYTQRFSI